MFLSFAQATQHAAEPAVVDHVASSLHHGRGLVQSVVRLLLRETVAPGHQVVANPAVGSILILKSLDGIVYEAKGYYL